MITDLRVRTATARLITPFAIAGGTLDVMESALVEIRDADGAVGLGEVNPMPPYSGLTLAQVRSLLEGPLRTAVVGAAGSPGVAHAKMDRVASGPAARLAKAAIDIALHDLRARRQGMSVAELLGGAQRDAVPLAWVVGLGDVDATIEEAVSRAREGYRTLKLKIGRDPQRDVAVVGAVREALPDCALRVDANAGYDVETAVDVLGRLADCGLELAEQPVPPGDNSKLAEVRRRTGVPIMADESLQTTADAISLLRSDACDVLNVKVTKLGGLHRAQQVAAIAEAAGVPIMVGSMPEMGVATAAGLEFARALPSNDHACELLGPFMLERDVIEPGRLRAADGLLSGEPDGAGLGLRMIA